MSPEPWTFNEAAGWVEAADGSEVAFVSGNHPKETWRANGLIVAGAPEAIRLASHLLIAFRAMKEPSWNLLIHKALDDLERFLTNPHEPAVMP